MKARVKATGEIVEVMKVCSTSTIWQSGLGNNIKLWNQSELDFDSFVTIEGWVARSYSCPRDLGLRVYSVKPKRYEKRKEWNGHGRLSYLIDHRLFPSVTWESEPKRVKITIIPME